MYNSAKSAVKLSTNIGAFFNCEIGVRQGDNLSPLLFALFLNDLQEFLAKAYNGLWSSFKLVENYVQDDDTVVYLKLFAILYADDTVIFAESRDELQAALNGMLHYCNIWKLEINSQKTKVVIYGSNGRSNVADFKFGNQFISVTCEYTYLGINMPCNGNLAKSIVSLRNQASKAMFAMFTKSKKLGLEVDVQLQLFDNLVQPIMLYGCEIWGFKNLDVLEKLHIAFCKMILKVNKSTTTAMVLGDLGRLPIEYNVNSRLLGFWYKLICGSDNKLSCIFYKLIYSLHVNQVYTTDWLKNIRIILAKCNLTEFWLNQPKVKALSFNSFKRLYKEKLKKCYVDKCLVDVQNSRKCCLYKNIKFELKLEDYLVTLIEPARSNLIRLRLSNHKMPIETGRHIGIDRNDRLCNICKSSDIDDEYHYFCICPVFKSVIVLLDQVSINFVNYCSHLTNVSKLRLLNLLVLSLKNLIMFT